MADLSEQQNVIALAKERYAQTEAYQSRLVSEYRRLHFFYRPNWLEDQWPEDKGERPGKLHISSNVIKPAVDINARLQAKLPRLSLTPTDLTEEERARAEAAEKGMLSYLEASGWDVWMHTLCRIKSLYGKGVLKVSWNKAERRPDVTVLENPANLRIGWGSSDFRAMDWALYEYSLSPFQIMERFPDLKVIPTRGDAPLEIMQRSAASHDDPLGQKSTTLPVPETYEPSDYERKQVTVWDYWYKRVEDGRVKVYNCIILQRNVHAKEPTHHRELADIPYIVIEHDHEPGSPEGISTAAPLIDLQIEMNRALSHWAQLVNDEIDPAWQVDADSVPGGMVPKGGEIIATGPDTTIRAIEKPVNTFPAEQLIRALWNQYHRTSGLGEIMFGDPSGSQVSGRALAVQIDAAANRLEPQRQLLYSGLFELIVFWTVMIERLNPKIEIEGQGKVGMRTIFEGFRRWKIVAPEITPRDVMEHTTNTINKINSKLMSNETGMGEIGIDSPRDELRLIQEERSTLGLYPGDVQVQLAVYQAMQALQINAQQLQAMVGGAAQDQTGMANAQADQQQAQPTLDEAENQPATGASGPPSPAGIQQTTLVRSTAEQGSQALNQLQINRQL